MKIMFTVLGTPEPAGSKRAFPIRRANGAIGVSVTDANPKAKSWQRAVAVAAREAYQGQLLDGPLCLSVTFYRPRPKGHFGSGKNANVLKPGAPKYPTTKPDATKLLRGVEDALTGELYRDDAQIVRQIVEKCWGEPACAEILLTEAS